MRGWDHVGAPAQRSAKMLSSFKALMNGRLPEGEEAAADERAGGEARARGAEH